VIIPQGRPTLGEEEFKAVDAVLRSRQLVMGPAVSDFEEIENVLSGCGSLLKKSVNA